MSIRSAIQAAATHGAHPVVVLDVDLTLLENAPRTRAILVDYARALGRAELVARAETMPIVFSIRENLLALGLEPNATGAGLTFWRDAFFDPARLVHDTALEGAVEAVHALKDAGATIVYLTARTRALAAATVTSFARLGLPIAEPGTVLVTKPDPLMHDERFKAESMRWIGRLGQVVACADNEPAHCNTMFDAFPAAHVVHVDTRHSQPAPPLRAGIRVVPSLLSAL